MSAPAPAAATTRTLGLAFVLLGAVAVVGGVALWPDPARAAPAACDHGALADACDPALDAARIEDLARGALAIGDDGCRRDATIGDAPGPDTMLARAVPPAAIAARRGVEWSRLQPEARALLDRLLERSAAALLGARAAAEVPRRGEPRAELQFAWAGAGRGGPFYVRVHGARFALEWVRTADGALHGAWRDFARDAAAPWLRDRVLAARR